MTIHPCCPIVASGVDFFQVDATCVAAMSDQDQSKFGESLLQQVAVGVEHAMERCVTKYGGLIWTIARRYAKNHASAEDIVQETFTDLWKSAHRFNQSTSAESTFVGMLARRRAIDFARKESSQPSLEPLSGTEEFPGFSEDASPSAKWHCDPEMARAAVNRLDEDTRKIFSLHFDEGLTHSEIVEKTGLPLGTVKTRLRRGLIEVRDILRRPQTTTSSTS